VILVWGQATHSDEKHRPAADSKLKSPCGRICSFAAAFHRTSRQSARAFINPKPESTLYKKKRIGMKRSLEIQEASWPSPSLLYMSVADSGKPAPNDDDLIVDLYLVQGRWTSREAVLRGQAEMKQTNRSFVLHGDDVTLACTY
jgi:hypothetical protein